MESWVSPEWSTRFKDLVSLRQTHHDSSSGGGLEMAGGRDTWTAQSTLLKPQIRGALHLEGGKVGCSSQDQIHSLGVLLGICCAPGVPEGFSFWLPLLCWLLLVQNNQHLPTVQFTVTSL